MPRLILKSPYLKPGRKKSPGGYLKYIATREGVEMAEDTSRHLPATTDQQKQIEKLLKKYPDSKDSHEYQDYTENPTPRPSNSCVTRQYRLRRSWNGSFMNLLSEEVWMPCMAWVKFT